MLHLHRHSEFSVLDGLGTADQYAERAAELGQPALAITDHGTIAGALHHIRACEKVGILPIVGVEAYYKPNAQPHNPDNKQYYHMVLLAKNLEGWQNLIRLTSLSFSDDYFYHKPIIDFELLKKYRKGLMCGSACFSSYLNKMIAKGDDKEAAKYIGDMLYLFNDDFYIEIMPNSMDDQKALNLELVNLAQITGVPVVATVDAHYPCHEWNTTHKILVEHIYEHEDDSLFLMSEEETHEHFVRNHPDLPESVVQGAIKNTHEIASRVEPYVLCRAPKYPRVHNAWTTIVSWCMEGMKRIGKNEDPVYQERLEYELRALKKGDVLDYFVIVGDLCRWMKESRIRVGAGRGSAAGSLVSYLIGITKLDPIAHGFLFERFINPDRVAMPDIDLDIDRRYRDRVKQYLKDKYGEDRVVDIGTFQTYKPKAALQRVAKAVNIPYEITDAIDDKSAITKSLEQIAKTNPAVAQWAKSHPVEWGHALRIEGQVRAEGKHASGVVVLDRPVDEILPTRSARDGSVTTAWSDRSEYPILSDFGFLKIDLLGLAAITIRERTLEMVEQRTGEYVEIDDLALASDPAAAEADVLAQFSRGKLASLFQFESDGMRRLLKQMEVDHFNDLEAAVALYRPGPMANIPDYIARKSGRASVTYAHPDLEGILAPTLGLYVYQEQAMQIARTIAGFSPGKTDVLRKAIGKKLPELMATLKDEFITGCLDNGYPEDLAISLWAENESSADYSFNKSHSGCYAFGSYQEMWLKERFPAEYYAALLSEEEDKDKIPRIIREMKGANIAILPPDINKSELGFTVDDGAVRFGLLAVKDVGITAVNEILRERKLAPYKGYEDMCIRHSRIKSPKAHRGVRKALLHVGAFDSLGGRDEWEEGDKAKAEKELLGHALTGNNYDAILTFVDQRIWTEAELAAAPDREEVIVGGEIARVKEILTKKGQPMAFVELVHRNDEYSITMFPGAWAYAHEFMAVGEYVIVSGEYDEDRGCVLAHSTARVEKIMEEMGVS